MRERVESLWESLWPLARIRISRAASGAPESLMSGRRPIADTLEPHRFGSIRRRDAQIHAIRVCSHLYLYLYPRLRLRPRCLRSVSPLALTALKEHPPATLGGAGGVQISLAPAERQDSISIKRSLPLQL